MTAPQAGDLVLRRVITGVLGCDLTPHDAAYQLEIVQADPRIHITDEILHDIAHHQRLHQHRGDHAKCSVMRLEPPAGEPPPVPWAQWHDHELDANPWPCSPDPVAPCYLNWLLRVDAINRTVIYRIGQYRWQTNTWEATWPD